MRLSVPWHSSLILSVVLVTAALTAAQPVPRPLTVPLPERVGVERSDAFDPSARPTRFRRPVPGERAGSPLELWSPPGIPARGDGRQTTVGPARAPGSADSSAATPVWRGGEVRPSEATLPGGFRWLPHEPDARETAPQVGSGGRFSPPDADPPQRSPYAPSVGAVRQRAGERETFVAPRDPRDPRFTGPVDSFSDLPPGERAELVRQRARAMVGRDGTNDAVQRLCAYPGACGRDWDRGVGSARSPDGPVTVGRVRCAGFGCGASAEGVQGPGHYSVRDNGGRGTNDPVMPRRSTIGPEPDARAVRDARAESMGDLARKVDERR